MQRTADFHHAIANPRLPEAAGVVDDATALDAAVHVLDARAAAGDAPIRGFRVGIPMVTWSSVDARKPRSCKRATCGSGVGRGLGHPFLLGAAAVRITQ
jgi:hypothetical protein